MFILLISRGIPSDKDPQWGCFERDQALALHKAGHKVVVLSVDSRVKVKNRKLGISHKNIEGSQIFDMVYMIVRHQNHLHIGDGEVIILQPFFDGSPPYPHIYKKGCLFISQIVTVPVTAA